MRKQLPDQLCFLSCCYICRHRAMQPFALDKPISTAPHTFVAAMAAEGPADAMQVEQWKDGKLLSTESVTDVEDAAAEPDDDWDDDEQACHSGPPGYCQDLMTATLQFAYI